MCLFLFHTFEDAAAEDQIALFKGLELKKAQIDICGSQSFTDLSLTTMGYTEWLVKTADMDQQFSEA